MKRLFAFVLLVLPFLSMTDPRTFVFVNPSSVQNIDDYNLALCKGDWDAYRYQDKRNTLHFESGLDVELLSANELTALGLSFKADRIRHADPEFDTKPMYRLAPGGVIVEVQTRIKYK